MQGYSVSIQVQTMADDSLVNSFAGLVLALALANALAAISDKCL